MSEKGSLTANPVCLGGELASAEAKDAPPIAAVVESPSDAAWRIISEWNLEKGYVSTESLLRLSKVLHPEVNR